MPAWRSATSCSGGGVRRGGRCGCWIFERPGAALGWEQVPHSAEYDAPAWRPTRSTKCGVRPRFSWMTSRALGILRPRPRSLQLTGRTGEADGLPRLEVVAVLPGVVVSAAGVGVSAAGDGSPPPPPPVGSPQAASRAVAPSHTEAQEEVSLRGASPPGEQSINEVLGHLTPR